jgi:3'(2'), 5'-bisphosphate nucleotidase
MNGEYINADFLGLIALEAGKAVLEIYEGDFSTEQKADASPITVADTTAHAILSRRLRERYPQIPILSEEGEAVDFETRRRWRQFWLIDPLDGTKEFIHRNGEFTINIALIEEGRPIMGVVYVPVLDLLYIGDRKVGCRREFRGIKTMLQLGVSQENAKLRVVHSRSHISDALKAFLERLPEHSAISRGSSLKFCAVAAGEADLYPRLGPTWEWDTAAGQAVLEAAGGIVVDMNGNPLRYNKEDLHNPAFVAASDRQLLQRIGVL